MNKSIVSLALMLALVLPSVSYAVAELPEFGYGGDPVACTMTATPDTITAGGGTLLDWEVSSNVVSAYLSPKNSTSWMQNVPLDGTWYISGIRDTRAYTLHVTGPEGQTATCDAMIAVEQAVEVAPTCDIVAVPDSITPGGATTLSWTSSSNVVSAVLHPKNSTSWMQSVPMNGSWYISGIVDSRSYSLTVETAGGLTATCDAPIAVITEVAEAPTCEITAVPNSITAGGGTTLVWDSSDNVVSAKLSPAGSTSYFATVTPAGSWYISGITNTRGYSVTVFTADNQSTVCTANITVTP